MDGVLLLGPAPSSSGQGHHPQLLWCAAGRSPGPSRVALTLHPLVERIKAEVPSLALNAWYLDDGTFVGPTEDLSAAL